METPTSGSVRREDDRITYINKGQFYGLTLGEIQIGSFYSSFCFFAFFNVYFIIYFHDLLFLHYFKFHLFLFWFYFRIHYGPRKSSSKVEHCQVSYNACVQVWHFCFCFYFYFTHHYYFSVFFMNNWLNYLLTIQQ